MHRHLLFIVGFAAVSSAAPIPQRVADAFAADGFVAATAVTHGTGLCVLARSVNATTNGGAAKLAYYCEGAAYDVGFALGVVAEPAVSLMTGPFLDHIVPSLISPEVDAWLQNSTFAPVRAGAWGGGGGKGHSDDKRGVAASPLSHHHHPSLISSSRAGV